VLVTWGPGAESKLHAHHERGEDSASSLPPLAQAERAASAIAGGAMLSEAAYAAGFADAAHMTRTFKGMLGVTPSELRRRSQSVQAR